MQTLRRYVKLVTYKQNSQITTLWYVCISSQFHLQKMFLSPSLMEIIIKYVASSCDAEDIPCSVWGVTC